MGMGISESTESDSYVCFTRAVSGRSVDTVRSAVTDILYKAIAITILVLGVTQRSLPLFAVAWQIEGRKPMITDLVKREIGEIFGQLLEYSYNDVRTAARSKGHTQALKSAQGWVELILAGRPQGKTPTAEFLHNSERN